MNVLCEKDKKDNWDINDVKNIVIKRAEKKVKVYEAILNNIRHRIGTAIDANRSYCAYQIPEFICGQPTFNMTNCVIYVLDKLKKKRFYAEYHHPYIIYVAWKVQIPENLAFCNSIPIKEKSQSQLAICPPSYKQSNSSHHNTHRTVYSNSSNRPQNNQNNQYKSNIGNGPPPMNMNANNSQKNFDANLLDVTYKSRKTNSKHNNKNKQNETDMLLNFVPRKPVKINR